MAELSTYLEDLEVGVLDDDLLHALEVTKNDVSSNLNRAHPFVFSSTLHDSLMCFDEGTLPNVRKDSHPGIVLKSSKHTIKPFKQRFGCRLLSFGWDVMWEWAESLLDRDLVGRCTFEKFCKVDFIPWLMEAWNKLIGYRPVVSKLKGAGIVSIF